MFVGNDIIFNLKYKIYIREKYCFCSEKKENFGNQIRRFIGIEFLLNQGGINNLIRSRWFMVPLFFADR